MTKIELLKLLEGIPDDAIVVVNGHSDGDGYDNITNVDVVQVISRKEPDWEGEYLDYDMYKEHYDREGKIPLIVYRIN
jgi:hypothetical protein